MLPVIKFSVEWNSLHQPASVMRLGAPTIHPSLLWPLLVMAAGMTALFARPASEGHAQRGAAPPRQGAAHRRGRGRRRPRRASLRGSAMDLGPHAAYIWAAYGVVALVLADADAWLVLDGRRQQRLVDELEARGVRRRSRRPLAMMAVREPTPPAPTPPRPAEAGARALVWPLAIFVVLAGALRLRAPQRRSLQAALRADRQAGAGHRACPARRPHRRRRVPCRASPAPTSRRARCRS